MILESKTAMGKHEFSSHTIWVSLLVVGKCLSFLDF